MTIGLALAPKMLAGDFTEHSSVINGLNRLNTQLPFECLAPHLRISTLDVAVVVAGVGRSCVHQHPR